ncbi:hypothetical protein RRU01S_23_01140 [Agrobacterium rubi TR3 = NBRC 13261]|uniref:Hemerythrin-like domain-containing protein n=1 Tax=Agrobacterium rubi TR3 = NBRC 13261 TaxID=1368415 RepID=A0A081CZE2_9HYPH|nr:hemerythrin domain-containing protein [Agrobacterium rubi]MBP1880356.1 iron-sulfur cluster repair protein YtfE (RIC family) [Agrobacterium rubi]GAK72038.1 hypothetical protein RRU01S_23_01140 [Agrobacterium rubi TR3 = NBRC 13261]
MNIFDLLNDSARPKAPAIPGATPADRIAGKRLALIHKMHLEAIDETKAVMEKVEAGQAGSDQLADKIASLEMMSNYAKFGNLCGRECEYLNYHHTAEDRQIFPILHQNGSDGLKRVIERLGEEHVVIHELLVELAEDAAAIRTQPEPETFSQARETFVLLDQVVRSHFGYEQTELEEALGYYNAL